MARVVTAIDVGHDAVKLVSLAERAGMAELASVVLEPLDELGRIEEGPEKVAALKMRLSKLIASPRLVRGETVIPISGRTTFVRYIRVPPIPPWRLEALMRFEATQQSGARTEDAADEGRAYDYRMLDVPDVEGQSVVLLAMSQEEAVEGCVEIARAAGAEDPDVELASLGLFNAYVYGHGTEDDEDKIVVLLDIGATQANLCIVRNGGLYFARHQRGGGRAFTDAVKKARGVGWAEAEEYKRSQARVVDGPAPTSSEEERLVAEGLAHEAAELVRSVEAALMYARAQTKRRELKTDKLLLSGGAARLAGLPEFLAARLEVEVSPLEPLRKISLGEMSHRDMGPLEGKYSSFAVPLGLALSRIEQTAARLDLRTSSDKARRDFRRRGIYLRAAAAVFAAGMIFWIAGAVRDRIAYGRAASAAEDRSNSDKLELKDLNSVRLDNERLQAEIDGMRERVTSGEDLLRALSQLKKRTPGWIRLVSVTTTRPRELERGAPDDESTFQGRRTIYVCGYARSTESPADAMARVKRYQDSLKELKELFEKIGEEVERGKLVAFDSGEPGAPDMAYFVFAIRIAKPQ